MFNLVRPATPNDPQRRQHEQNTTSAKRLWSKQGPFKYYIQGSLNQLETMERRDSKKKNEKETGASTPQQRSSGRSLKTPASGATPPQEVFDDKVRWERIRNGQCPTCGIQLFKIKGKGVFRQNVQMKPLNVKGQVDNGTCLLCSGGKPPPTKKGTDNESPATMMSSTMDDNENKGGKGGPAAATQQAPAVNKTPEDAGPPIKFISADSFNAFSSSFRFLNTDDVEDEDNEEDLVSFYSHEVSNKYITGKPVTEDFSRRISMEEFACVPNPGVECIYEGDYNQMGAREGRGDLIWPNGDRYSGDFVRNTRHGQGSMYFDNDGDYVGDWATDKMNGEGTRQYGNGDVYKGEYVAGLRQGKGRYAFSNGDVYTGSFEGDEFHGFGRFEYCTSGSRPCFFEGTYIHGLRDGKGEFHLANGEMDIQRYSNDERVGEGVRWSADRRQSLRLEENCVREQLNELEAAHIADNCDCDLWETMDD